MRVLLKVSIPMESGNQAMKDGSFGPKMKSILEQLKPEAAYFVEEEGLRTGIIVTDLPDPSGIPAIAEPFFLAFNAKVQMHPAMVVADLEKAWPDIQAAVGKHG